MILPRNACNACNAWKGNMSHCVSLGLRSLVAPTPPPPLCTGHEYVDTLIKTKAPQKYSTKMNPQDLVNT